MNIFTCYRIHPLLKIVAAHQNNIAVYTQMGKAMAKITAGVPLFHSAPSVNAPVFDDLEKYLPNPTSIHQSNISPPDRKYPEPSTTSTSTSTSTTIHERQVRPSVAKNSNMSAKTRDIIVVDLTREERTVSVSSGESTRSKSVYNTGKRPAKRRHHSEDLTRPGYVDDVRAGYKKPRMNYSNLAPEAARSLKFQRYEVTPPVFTLDTLTSEIKQECAKSVQSTSTLEKKLKLKSFLESTLSPLYSGCTLHLCGSSSNGFGGDSSDADFCLILSRLRQATHRREALAVLRQMYRLLIANRYSFIGNLTVIPASVPILKFKDTISGCECDININNIVGVRNTHLLRGYCGADYRVQPLVILVKKWAKKHNINDASQGTLSSYALTLMVIHYLQAVCKPAVVPVLQLKYPGTFQYRDDVQNLLSQDPCKHIACNKSENRQSLGELCLGFFKYYAEDYRWSEDYISIKKGSALPRNNQWIRKRIVIEEPFDGNNVAKSVCSDQQFSRITLKLRLACHTLRMSPSLESIKVT